MSTTATASPVAPVPTEDEALARVERALDEGVAPAGLDPALVLGLDPAEVASACDRSGEEPPVAAVGEWRRQLSWRESQYLVNHGMIAACAPRRFPTEVMDQLSAISRDRNMCLAFHSSAIYHPHVHSFATYIAALPIGWVSVVTRSHLSGDQVRIGRMGVYTDPLRGEDLDGWTPIDLDGERVAQMRPHPFGSGVVILLGVNPFQGRSVRGEPAGLSGRQASGRAEVLRRILDAAQAMIGEHAWAARQPDARQLAIRRAVGVVQAVQAMAASHTARLDHQRREAEQRIANMDERIERLRTDLVRHLREVDETRMTLEALAAAAPAQQARAATEAMSTLSRIRALAPVRECGVVSTPHGFALSVGLHPYVFTPANSDRRRLLGSLGFQVMLDDHDARILWSQCSTISPHPHVSSAGITCWGNAQVPVTEAMGRRDWLTLVVLITGWVTQHNPRSEYTSITEFPVTDAPGGWVLPEIEADTDKETT